MIGIRVRNNSNFLQIDENYQNLEVGFQGTATTATQDTTTQELYVDVPIPTGRGNPVFAVKANAGVYWKKLNASTYRVYSPSQTPVSFTYFVFVSPIELSGGIGFKVRSTSSGKVVFNSRNKYLRVIDYIQQSMATDTSFTKQYPGKTVALVQTLRAFHVQLTQGGTTQNPILIIRNRGSRMSNPANDTIQIEFNTTWAASLVGGNSPAVANGLTNIGYLVVEVTGY